MQEESVLRNAEALFCSGLSHGLTPPSVGTLRGYNVKTEWVSLYHIAVRGYIAFSFFFNEKKYSLGFSEPRFVTKHTFLRDNSLIPGNICKISYEQD